MQNIKTSDWLIRSPLSFHFHSGLLSWEGNGDILSITVHR